MNKTPTTTKILVIIAIVIIIIVATLLGNKAVANLQEKHEIKVEQARLSGLLEEINNLYVEQENLTAKWNELEAQQEELHGSAELNRQEIDRLWNEYYKDNDTDDIMGKICIKSPKSPMCNNYGMLEDLKKISEERNVDYKLLLGIMYAESHIGANFNQENCRQTHNRAGLKWKKNDDGSISEKFSEQYKTLDKDLNGCWLYYYEDEKEFFKSLANTIGKGYAKCNGDVYCINKSFVGHESAARVNNVYQFYK